MNNIALKNFHIWKNKLKSISKKDFEALLKMNEEIISDSFYKDLSFGTGGLRGKMGLGTNRINAYTIYKATRGVGLYLKTKFNKPSVVIGYDSRNHSQEYAYLSANVFANLGIKTYIFKELIFMTRDTSGKNINLSYRGDGIKSMHIPAILKYIAEQDNKNLGSNAITYTQIWGYEEPENGVELRKCFDLAKEFMGFSDQIQQFITTHSPGFYGLGKKDNVKVYYVYKSNKDYSSVIQENVNVMDIHDKIGILPIVAPIIEEKENELQQMRRNLENLQFTDVDTIFVEGITDKKYLEKAIQLLSKDLHQKISEGTLKIVTREENGCGTSLLCDWAVAWMHFNYKSKAVILLDCDKAGNEAKKKIENAQKEFQKKSFKLKVIQIQPTEDMKIVQAKIQKSLIFEIEHLLSYDFWKKLQQKNWVEVKEVNELVLVYGHLITRDNSLDTIIEDVVENEALKQTIIYWNPKDSKKDKIYEYAEQCCMESDEIFRGFSNTIRKLEKYFL